MTQTLLRWLNTLAFLEVLLVNGFADALPVSGGAAGQLSAIDGVQLTAEPYAFSMRGLIYVLLLGFVVVQWLPKVREREEVKRIGPWFLVCCLFNVSWLLVWHYSYWNASLWMMLGLLLSALALYMSTRADGWSSEPWLRWLVQAPISMYLSWLTVTAIVNITAALNAAGWDSFGMSGTVWTVFIILLAAVVSLTLGWLFHDPVYVMVLVGVLLGLGEANLENLTIVYMARTAAALLFIYALCLLGTKSLPWSTSSIAGS